MEHDAGAAPGTYPRAMVTSRPPSFGRSLLEAGFVAAVLELGGGAMAAEEFRELGATPGALWAEVPEFLLAAGAVAACAVSVHYFVTRISSAIGSRRAAAAGVPELKDNSVVSDVYNALRDAVVARAGTDGWLVRAIGDKEFTPMPQKEFAEFEKWLAAKGETLVKIAQVGTAGGKPVFAMTRRQGGRISDGPDGLPALLAFDSAGRVLEQIRLAEMLRVVGLSSGNADIKRRIAEDLAAGAVFASERQSAWHFYSLAPGGRDVAAADAASLESRMASSRIPFVKLVAGPQRSRGLTRVCSGKLTR